MSTSSNIPSVSSRFALMRALEQNRMSSTPSAGSNLSSCSDASTPKVTMKTTVAVRDDTPHRFQLVPLREVGTRLAGNTTAPASKLPAPSTHSRSNMFLDLADSSSEPKQHGISGYSLQFHTQKKENTRIPNSKSSLLPAGARNSTASSILASSESGAPSVLAAKDPNANDKRARRYITTENLGSAWLMYLGGALTSSSTASTVSSARHQAPDNTRPSKRPGSNLSRNSPLSIVSAVSESAPATFKTTKDAHVQGDSATSGASATVLDTDSKSLETAAHNYADSSDSTTANNTHQPTPRSTSSTMDPLPTTVNASASDNQSPADATIRNAAIPLVLPPVLPLRINRSTRSTISGQGRALAPTRSQPQRYFLPPPSPVKVTRTSISSSTTSEYSQNNESRDSMKDIDRDQAKENDSLPSITAQVISQLELGLSDQLCEMLLEEMSETDCDENENEEPRLKVKRKLKPSNRIRLSALSTATTNGSNVPETDVDRDQDNPGVRSSSLVERLDDTSLDVSNSTISTTTIAEEVTRIDVPEGANAPTKTRTGTHRRNRKRPSTTSFTELEYYCTAHVDSTSTLDALTDQDQGSNTSLDGQGLSLRSLKRKYNDKDQDGDYGDHPSHENQSQGQVNLKKNNDEGKHKSINYNIDDNDQPVLGRSIDEKRIDIDNVKSTSAVTPASASRRKLQPRSRPSQRFGNLKLSPTFERKKSTKGGDEGQGGCNSDGFRGLVSLSPTTHVLLDAHDEQPRKRYAIYTRSLQIPVSSLKRNGVLSSDLGSPPIATATATATGEVENRPAGVREVESAEGRGRVQGTARAGVDLSTTRGGAGGGVTELPYATATGITTPITTPSIASPLTTTTTTTAGPTSFSPSTPETPTPLSLTTGSKICPRTNPHAPAAMFKAVSSRLANPYINLYPQSVASFQPAPSLTSAPPPPPPPLPPKSQPFSATGAQPSLYAPTFANVAPYPNSNASAVAGYSFGQQQQQQQQHLPNPYISTQSQAPSSQQSQALPYLQGQSQLPPSPSSSQLQQPQSRVYSNQSLSQSQPQLHHLPQLRPGGDRGHPTTRGDGHRSVSDTGGANGHRASASISAGDVPALLKPGVGYGVGLGLQTSKGVGLGLGLEVEGVDGKDAGGDEHYDEPPPAYGSAASTEKSAGAADRQSPSGLVSLSRSSTLRSNRSVRRERERERYNRPVVQAQQVTTPTSPQIQLHAPQPSRPSSLASSMARVSSSSGTDEFQDMEQCCESGSERGLEEGEFALLERPQKQNQTDITVAEEDYRKWVPLALPYHPIVLELFSQIDDFIFELDGMKV
ncbi:hypothetical protein AX16_000126 [Volvariella volvacea WC 439]|nr:hypothetical protein AX16_000126 [Volvariella volvacea WC 439]